MRYRLRITLLLGVLLAAACARGGSEPASSEPGAAPAPAASASTPLTDGAAPATLEPLGQKVTIAYPSVASSFLPLWLAADEGLFGKNGLDVEVTFIASGTT